MSDNIPKKMELTKRTQRILQLARGANYENNHISENKITEGKHNGQTIQLGWYVWEMFGRNIRSYLYSVSQIRMNFMGIS